MPRSTSKSAPQAQKALQAPPSAVEPEEREHLFDLVVETFQGLLPGSDGYDAEKDKLMIGFMYGNSTVPAWLPKGTEMSDITPYDFLTDPTTGKRAGQSMKPHGCGYVDLQTGISSWADLPPLYIWKKGMWLADAIFEDGFKIDSLTSWIKKEIEVELPKWPKTGTPLQLYNYWIVSGEGTTGNNLYRVYELPDEIAKSGDPHHPRMWRKELQEKRYATVGGGSTGYTGSTGSRGSTGYTAPKAPSIPAGVRYRCAGCGHWYTQQDLVGHAQVCGKGEDADWAMMCHSDCGCKTLDQASSPKPGFPRTPKIETPTVAEGTEEAKALVEAQVPVTK